MQTAPERTLRGVDLRAERVRRGLTQRELAARLGVSGRRVANVEGQWRPAATFAVRYMAALGADDAP